MGWVKSLWCTIAVFSRVLGVSALLWIRLLVTSSGLEVIGRPSNIHTHTHTRKLDSTDCRCILSTQWPRRCCRETWTTFSVPTWSGCGPDRTLGIGSCSIPESAVNHWAVWVFTQPDTGPAARGVTAQNTEPGSGFCVAVVNFDVFFTVIAR